MKRKLVYTLLICLLLSSNLIGQVISLNSNQSLPLVVNAGSDVSIYSGNSATIGANPSASLGYGGYIYLWTPPVGLDDPTKANPMASPSATTTYLLTVTDSKNCSVQDEVTVTVRANGMESSVDIVKFKVYPNPTNGNLLLDIEGFSGPLILKIVNSTGIVVHEVNREIVESYRDELDTRVFPAGNYYVMMICNGKVITKPLIIL
jgi:hypothetical protein